MVGLLFIKRHKTSRLRRDSGGQPTNREMGGNVSLFIGLVETNQSITEFWVKTLPLDKFVSI
jgi:hypothetical protein